MTTPASQDRRTSLIARLAWGGYFGGPITPWLPPSALVVANEVEELTDDELLVLSDFAEYVDEWHITHIRPPHFDGGTNYIHVRRNPSGRWTARRGTWEYGYVEGKDAASLAANWKAEQGQP